MSLRRTAATAAVGAALLVVPVGAANAQPDTACMRAGINALKGEGAFSAVARDGLPISTAVALGVTPRPGTDVSALPEVLPLSVVLADHRAGEDSLFVYPWCG